MALLARRSPSYVAKKQVIKPTCNRIPRPARNVTTTRCLNGRQTVVADNPDLAQRIVTCFYEVQHPALSNRRYSSAVQDFTDASILAYECGYTENSICEQLKSHVDLLPQIGNRAALDSDACLLCISIVWVTLMHSPKTVKRWSTARPVTEATYQQWGGFVGMIVNAYFEKRMSWFPIDRLQLELAVHDVAQPDDVVSEWARIVYTTLARVYPQFPSMHDEV